MPQASLLTEFLLEPGTILDVRSPAEFEQGHIPGSFSLPLFSNTERAQIGTHYKTHGHQSAVELGLLLVEPKVDALLNQASRLITSSAKVLCWRGGMRSGFTARLLELAGYPAITLQGGYKSYRRWALKSLTQPLPHAKMYVLGGLTGSGKTEILHALKQIGEQTIDLEGLANHRGSAFGGIGLSGQPSQESFENQLAWQISHLNLSKPIWLEDESKLIGRCYIPSPLYDQMHRVPLLFLECDKKLRLKNLMQLYGQASADQLLQAVRRITKRLGSQLTNEIAHLLENCQREEAFNLLLSYYDKTYQHLIDKRTLLYRLQEPGLSTPAEWAAFLKNYTRELE